MLLSPLQGKYGTSQPKVAGVLQMEEPDPATSSAPKGSSLMSKVKTLALQGRQTIALEPEAIQRPVKKVKELLSSLAGPPLPMATPTPPQTVFRNEEYFSPPVTMESASVATDQSHGYDGSHDQPSTVPQDNLVEAAFKSVTMETMYVDLTFTLNKLARLLFYAATHVHVHVPIHVVCFLQQMPRPLFPPLTWPLFCCSTCYTHTRWLLSTLWHAPFLNSLAVAASLPATHVQNMYMYMYMCAYMLPCPAELPQWLSW